MTEALAMNGGERVLEIGTGSGYAAAILSQVAGDVYTVERIGQLAEKSASLLADLGYDNVHVLHGDGTKGWPDHAPYDGIIVAAGGPKIPESLKEQLKIGGRLVIPVEPIKRFRNSSALLGFPSGNFGARTWPTFDLSLSLGMKDGKAPKLVQNTGDRGIEPKLSPKKSQLFPTCINPVRPVFRMIFSIKWVLSWQS